MVEKQRTLMFHDEAVQLFLNYPDILSERPSVENLSSDVRGRTGKGNLECRSASVFENVSALYSSPRYPSTVDSTLRHEEEDREEDVEGAEGDWSH